jgi:hypothetical protein
MADMLFATLCVARGCGAERFNGSKSGTPPESTRRSSSTSTDGRWKRGPVLRGNPSMSACPARRRESGTSFTGIRWTTAETGTIRTEVTYLDNPTRPHGDIWLLPAIVGASRIVLNNSQPDEGGKDGRFRSAAIPTRTWFGSSHPASATGLCTIITTDANELLKQVPRRHGRPPAQRLRTDCPATVSDAPT